MASDLRVPRPCHERACARHQLAIVTVQVKGYEARGVVRAERDGSGAATPRPWCRALVLGQEEGAAAEHALHAREETAFRSGS